MRLALPAMLVCASFAFAAEKPAPPKDKPCVVVFDFTSDFDGGRVGKFVSNNLLAKLDRTGDCVLVDRTDFNETMEKTEFKPGFDSDPAELVKFAADNFGATDVIWGKVEKTGEESLKITARSAGRESGGGLAFDAAVEVKNQYEVQTATKEFVNRFFEIAPPEPEIGPAEEKNWAEGPNLVKNPSFEEGNDHPASWDAFDKDYQHKCVSWAAVPDGKGKCIKFDIAEDIAATYGAAYYSEPISIKDGKLYRFSIRVRSDAPTVKIFLKHYKFFPPGPNEQEGQWRETRRAPLNCKGGKPGEWQTYTRDFRPHRNDAQDPEVTRVEFYAYWPKGVVYFDDVVLKKLK